MPGFAPEGKKKAHSARMQADSKIIISIDIMNNTGELSMFGVT